MTVSECYRLLSEKMMLLDALDSTKNFFLGLPNPDDYLYIFEGNVALRAEVVLDPLTADKFKTYLNRV